KSRLLHFIRNDTRLPRRFTPRNDKLKSFIMLFLIFVPTFVLISSLSSEQVEAAWYDQGYSFRKRIHIANSPSGNNTNFQISINLNTSTLISAGKMQSDCDDIRFTDIAGK